MKKVGFGAIGVGQAGINIASQFAKEDIPTVAIDTTKKNLESTEHIKEDLKFHAKINDWGGAGKRSEDGEKAIIKHQEDLFWLFERNFKDCDYVWICNSLGGGTGTLGGIQISNILNALDITHGMMVTLPDESQEGIDEIENAYIGLGSIERARKEFEFLRSIIIIENSKLKNLVKDKYDVGFEDTWKKANEYIFNQFYSLYEYSQKSSNFTLDGQDYLRIIEKKGYMTFGQITQDIDNASENVLINEIEKTWKNNVFIDKLDFSKAKGLGVVVDRPESYKDGKKIDNFLKEMKNFVGTATFCQGIYQTKEGIAKKAASFLGGKEVEKPLTMITAISGMPFPEERFSELEKLALENADIYNNKDNQESVDLKLNKLSSLRKEKVKKSREEKSQKDIKTFSIFNKPTKDSNNKKENNNNRKDKLSKLQNLKNKKANSS